MKLAAIAFTARGLALGERLRDGLAAQGDALRLTQGFGHEEHPPLYVWACGAMREADGVIFIGAAGIAVRAIAPHLRGKQEDPAVVVLDEQGRFAISLLSGHTGGANRLALRVAALVGAQPIITTATDGRGLFAVDSWAKEKGLSLANPEMVKAVSAALLAGRPVGMASAFPIEGPLPEGMVLNAQADAGVYIGVDGRYRPFAQTLQVVPPVLVLGMGCRRGTPREALEAAADAALAQLGSTRRAVCAVHTIDRKADEPGLLAMCEQNGWPLRVFTAEVLAAIPGSFTASVRVLETVGVDNVCERAAVAMGGRLLLPKQAGNGVTAAVAALPYTVRFKEENPCKSPL